jgi:hypothetical protein
LVRRSQSETGRNSLPHPTKRAACLKKSSSRFPAPAIALALAASASSAASVARAQQPPIPPVGEPPPPELRAQEQAAIENEVTQTYYQTHKDELQKQAAAEVEAERRQAWEQRGRDQIPPGVVARLPGLEANLNAHMSTSTEKTETGLGVSTALKFRLKKWWGFEAGGGFFAMRGESGPAVPGTRFAAPFGELSGIAWAGDGARQGRREPDHIFLRAGMQLLFPLGAPNIPPTYLTPFVGVGSVFAFGQLGKGYVAIHVEARAGYRIGIGSRTISPLEGGAIDVMAGPTVGF